MFKIGIRGFSKMLITIELSYILNCTWRLQYGSSKFEESLNFHRNYSTEVFVVSDHKLAIRLSKFEVAVKVRGKLIFYLKTVWRGFRVRWSNFVIGLSKFKMADTIWQLKVIEQLKLCSKLVYRGFRRCWSRFCYQTLKI